MRQLEPSEKTMKRRYHSRSSGVHLQMEHPPSHSSHPGDFVIRNLGPFFERSRVEIQDFALRLEKFPLSFSLARTFFIVCCRSGRNKPAIHVARGKVRTVAEDS